MADPPLKSNRLFRTALLAAGLIAVAVVVVVLARFLFIDDADSGVTTPVAAAAVKLHKPAPRPTGYVGSTACAQCHPKISETYQTHPMARSLHRVLDATPMIENYDDRATFSPPGSRQYRVERSKEAVLHHEIKLDSDGTVLYDQALPIHYSIGSGKRGRTYVIDRGGLLFLSPISWYSKTSQWDLSPGYRPADHPRFFRRASDVCLHCHAGRLALRPGKRDRYEDPPFLELGIGCERCHGPGKEHIARRLSQESVSGEDPIVNPASLDPVRRDSVCNQCHLQGKVKFLRYGRSVQDFRPGDRLGDFVTIFVDGTGVGGDSRTTAVHHVQQMHASACFRQSEGRLGCISCHDAHFSPPEHEKVDFYRSKCMQCHVRPHRECALPIEEREQPPAANSCIHCHMPRLGTSDVPHVTQTDHRVVRRAGTQPLMAKSQAGTGRLEIFELRESSLSGLEESRARGLMLAWKVEASGDVNDARKAEQLLKPIRRAAPDDVDVLNALAITCIVRGRDSEAVRYWESALEIDPEREHVLYSLVLQYHETGQFRKAEKYIERFLAINPFQADLYGRRSHILAMRGQLDLAIESARRGLEVDPSMLRLYLWLADLYEKRGNFNESRRYRDLWRRMQNR